jgi:RND family efflux transporter MFP subunit
MCVLCACGGGKQEETFLHSVSLIKPSPLENTSVKRYSGTSQEAHRIDLGFKTAGQLSRIYVTDGDFVRKGQLLATLDDVDYKLGVEASQIQYDQLKTEVERLSKLNEQKSISANEYEKAVAGLRQLGVQLQANKNKLDYTRLYAPSDGFIEVVNFSPAEMVNAGTPVFGFMDVSRMEVVADIPASEYVNRNKFVKYTSSVMGNEEVPMRLIGIVPKADGTQLYRLRLTYSDKPSKNLTAGMNTDIRIYSVDGEGSVGFTLPLSSVAKYNDETYVWVLAPDSTIRKQPIVIESTCNKGRAVVVSGLNGEENVIKAGVNYLQENEKVKVLEEASKSNVGGLL